MDLEKLKEQLIEHEGLRLKPYRCTAGRLTIGVGRNLDDKGISRDEAMALLQHDIEESVAGAKRVVSNFDELADARQRVVVDMCFNLGESRVAAFRKMLAAVERGDFDQAASEMLDSLWARQVGWRAERLAEMMREGR